MKTFLTATTALVLLASMASPGSAQLLGGGGGGALGGALGGSLGGPLSQPMGTIGSATRGTLDGAASTSGSHKVDRRSGSVHADRSASGSISGTLDSTTALPGRALAGNGSGTASGSGNGGADAQLIGTDALGNTASGAVGSSRTIASGLRDRAGQSTGMVPTPLSGASGAADGSGAGSFSGALGQLALAGSSAASGAGSFDVMPGMAIVNRSGRAIGTVRSVATDAKGRIKSVVVGVADRTAAIPAANFTGSGNVLVSAMGKGELKDAAKDQKADTPMDAQ